MEYVAISITALFAPVLALFSGFGLTAALAAIASAWLLGWLSWIPAIASYQIGDQLLIPS